MNSIDAILDVDGYKVMRELEAAVAVGKPIIAVRSTLLANAARLIQALADGFVSTVDKQNNKIRAVSKN